MSDDTFRWAILGGVAISTLCILATAIAAIAVYRLVSRLHAKAEDVTTRAIPILETAEQLTRTNAPKVSEIASNFRVLSANARDISEVAKDQAHRFAEVGRDIADRAKVQVARVDAAVDDTVDQVQHAGTNLRAAALKPVREASGVIAGVKAAVATLAQGRRPSVDHITQDEEMFI
jgi:hypothetical protein